MNARSERARLTGGCDAVAQYAVDGVRALQPYQPGKPLGELEREYGVRDAVKLASNENPLGVAPAARAAMARELDGLWLYPDGGGFGLRRALAAHHGVEPACITLGNGSNDVLVLIAETFLAPGREAVYSQYAFAVYPIAVQAAGATARIVPALGPESGQALGHDLEAMAAAISPDTRVVFVANPNNPTGTWVTEDALRRFLESVSPEVVVVVDEAYHEYALAAGAPDASAWLGEFPNLVISRTFSKAYGLAGIRVGYTLSSPEIAGLLNRVRQPFNVNSLALAGAEAALGDQEFIARTVNENAAGMAQLGTGLAGLGFEVAPSAGNFLLLDLGRDAAPVNEALLRQGVIVRPVAGYGLPRHLRVTVGTAAGNDRFINALAHALEGSTA